MLNWFLQIVFALKFIHSKKILHRDLKTSNLFLSSSGVVKIGDFGISRVLHGTLESAQTIVGTPYYMSPEVCQNKPYSFKSDVWSLGCILFELCSLRHAFQAKNLLGLVCKIVKEPHDVLPNNFSSGLKKLIDSLLEKDPLSRPSCDQLLQTKFMQGVLYKFLHPDSVSQLNERLEEERKDAETETPAQRLKRNKERAAWERGEEIKRAMGESQLSNMEIKERKKTQLSSAFDKEATYNDLPTRTIESIQLSRLIDPGFGLKKSLGLGISINKNISKGFKEDGDMWGRQSKEFERTNKELDNMPKDSFVTIQSQYMDSQSLRPSFNEKPKEKKEKEEVDEFHSDFEELDEFISDEGVEENREQSKNQKFKDKLSQRIGPRLFDKLYSFMKRLKEKGASELTIKKQIQAKFGKASLVHCFDIEQLLFMENH